METALPKNQRIVDERTAAINGKSKPAKKSKWKLELKPARELGNGKPRIALWQGLIWRGCSTLLVGKHKWGKTTLLLHMLKAMSADGGNIAGDIKPAKVAVLSEENEEIWRERGEEYELGDRILFGCMPFGGRPSAGDWKGACQELGKRVVEEKFDLVILDTFRAFNPGKENDSDDASSTLVELQPVLKAGAAVVVVHHTGKAGDESRGSSAVDGWADVIVKFGLMDGQTEPQADSRRVIRANGRFDDITQKAVVSLGTDGYETISVDRQQGLNEKLSLAIGPLQGGSWMRIGDIHGQYAGNKLPSVKTLQRRLLKAEQLGLIECRIAKAKGAPAEYRIRDNDNRPK